MCGTAVKQKSNQTKQFGKRILSLDKSMFYLRGDLGLHCLLSIFFIKGVSGVHSHFINFFFSIQILHSVASELALHCIPKSLFYI